MNLKLLLGALILLIASFSASSEVRHFLDGAITLSGSFKQGTLLEGKLSLEKLAEKNESIRGNGCTNGKCESLVSSVSLDGRNVRFTETGEFVLGFGRDAALDQTIVVKLLNGASYDISFSIQKRKYNTQHVNGVPQKTVTPSEDKLARIRAETALVKEARKTDSNREFFLSKFKAPMETQITGVYGSQRVYNGIPKRPHFGIDYAGKHGEPVYAPANAVVTLVHKDMYYSGGTLIVDHGYGVSSTFIHLSEILVSEGEEVKQGDIIAKVGSGGRSTGPHLDWRVNWYHHRVDPLLVLEKDF